MPTHHATDQPTDRRDPTMTSEKGNPGYTASMALGALGIVFGDIGTSPLYALQQCFQGFPGHRPGPSEVLGILSLIFWSLILVVCVKYLTFIIRCDHDGEGGTLALLGLVKRKHRKGSFPGGLVLMVLFGSALLYGDGVITPSISVLSAVEGLKVATPDAEPYVVPLSIGILVALFLLQRRGTAGIGTLFGPIMVVWFMVIGLLGIGGIAKAPQVLAAVNPAEAIHFLGSHGWPGVLVLGAVVLCFSGAEALFADLGHFGRGPIRLAWYVVVLPALLLNYFGQGAWLLTQPDHAMSLFFALVPSWALYPMVGISTAATVIASQALISGVFSLTEQAIHMGYCPRFAIVHTSRKERGQVYVQVINYALMLGCIGIVLGFRSSDRLGGAYGLAVIGTMTVTSLTYYVVLRRVSKWSRVPAGLLAGIFLLVDLAFLAGNLGKIFSGAWVPLLIAGLVFEVFWIWSQGRVRYERALAKWALPIGEFQKEIESWTARRDSTCVLLTRHPDTVPLVKKSAWLRFHVRHEQVLLVTLVDETVPYVSKERMGRVEQLGPGFYHLIGSFGFMQHPDVTRLLKNESGTIPIHWDCLVCYLPEATLISRGGWWARAILSVYNFLGRNSLSMAHYLRIPPDQVVHVGVTLEV
jgi:KUP system potassium uptake protein